MHVCCALPPAALPLNVAGYSNVALVFMIIFISPRMVADDRIYIEYTIKTENKLSKLNYSTT